MQAGNATSDAPVAGAPPGREVTLQVVDRDALERDYPLMAGFEYGKVVHINTPTCGVVPVRVLDQGHTYTGHRHAFGFGLRIDAPTPRYSRAKRRCSSAGFVAYAGARVR